MSDFTIVRVSAPTPTPTGLSAKSSPGLILLNWDEQPDVRSTIIYESTTNNRNNSILLGETTETTFADSVNAGETRYYWIRHRNDVGSDLGDFFPADVSAGLSAYSKLVGPNDVSFGIFNQSYGGSVSTGTDVPASYNVWTTAATITFTGTSAYSHEVVWEYVITDTSASTAAGAFLTLEWQYQTTVGIFRTSAIYTSPSKTLYYEEDGEVKFNNLFGRETINFIYGGGGPAPLGGTNVHIRLRKRESGTAGGQFATTFQRISTIVK